LEVLPDQALLDGLRQARGRGRDDFPIDVLWGVVVFTVALRHVTFRACLDEWRRHPTLYRLLGLSSVADIPHDWNVSRFVDVLGQEPHLGQLRKVFDVLAQRLGRVVPDLGEHVAGDATPLNGRAKQAAAAVAAEIEQGLPQPSGGKKEYQDEAGTVVKVVEWFGYQQHLLVDVKHAVPLAYQITDTQAGDNELIGPLLDQAKANLPAQRRIQTLAYDKAADAAKVHERLHQEGIKPLIQNRALWPDELERPLPGPAGRYPLHIVHDEAGTVYCYDTVSDPPRRHSLAYIGYEKDRETLKYRCPARHQGWDCPSDQRCNAGQSYGLVVRVDWELDLRHFPPIPRATKEFERRYKGRTAAERVNARLQVFWGADDGNVTGARRFHGYLGVVMVVCLAFATLLALTPRREGSMGNTRLSPIALALQELAWAEEVEAVAAAEANRPQDEAPAIQADTG
jgi:hypothetical protein